MIADLKPYPAMKDSGVEWLGDVPEHWEVRRLGSLGTFSASGIDKNTVEGEPLVQMVNYLDVYKNPTHELRGTRKYMTVSCPEWKKRVHAAKRGDMFFTPSSETVEDIGWSAVAVEDLEDTVYSYHIIRFRSTSEMDVGFQKYWCNNRPVLDQFSVACKGTTRQILTRGDFRSILAPLPPILEQNPIARFLDYVDRRLRRYVRAKQKLIELLEEQKQAIIHRAVTRGLDPDVPLKPSGVDWLGDIPEHWEVKKLKYAVRFSGGGTPSKANESFWNGHIPWVSPKDMRSARIADAEDHITEEAVSESATSIVAPGAVLIVVRSGILRRKIPVAINDVDVALNQDMKALRPRSVLASEYLLALVQGNQAALLNEWTKQGATVESIEYEFMANSLIPLPPLSEQSAIVEYLEKATAGIDTAMDRARREIELLREYRTRLIADVVTGKVDVRGIPVEAVPEDEALEGFVESEEMEEALDVEEAVDAND